MDTAHRCQLRTGVETTAAMAGRTSGGLREQGALSRQRDHCREGLSKLALLSWTIELHLLYSHGSERIGASNFLGKKKKKLTNLQGLQ